MRNEGADSDRLSQGSSSASTRNRLSAAIRDNLTLIHSHSHLQKVREEEIQALAKKEVSHHLILLRKVRLYSLFLRRLAARFRRSQILSLADQRSKTALLLVQKTAALRIFKRETKKLIKEKACSQAIKENCESKLRQQTFYLWTQRFNERVAEHVNQVKANYLAQKLFFRRIAQKREIVVISKFLIRLQKKYEQVRQLRRKQLFLLKLTQNRQKNQEHQCKTHKLVQCKRLKSCRKVIELLKQPSQKQALRSKSSSKHLKSDLKKVQRLLHPIHPNEQEFHESQLSYQSAKGAADELNLLWEENKRLNTELQLLREQSIERRQAESAYLKRMEGDWALEKGGLLTQITQLQIELKFMQNSKQALEGQLEMERVARQEDKEQTEEQRVSWRDKAEELNSLLEDYARRR